MDQTVDVFGWLADRQGCGTIRVMQPLDALSSEVGLNVDYNERFNPKGMMPKIFMGQRVCKDGPSDLWQAIAKLDQRPRLVYEVDDDLWNVDPTNRIAFEWFINGYDVESNKYHSVAYNLENNISVADVVTCTTPALAEILSQWNSNVRIVPNYIPKWLLEHDRPRRERLTLGWIGSATHEMDWAVCSRDVRKHLERNPQVDLKIIGAEANQWLKIPKDRIVETGWFKDVTDSWRAIDFDIGLAPLRPHVFNRSKSAIKFLEYSALGIPIIASDVGPYHDNIVHGETGFLVKYDHEWSKYLRLLTNDEAARKEIGNNAKKWAATQTLEGNVHKWMDALTR